MNDYEDLLESLSGLAESLQTLNQQAVREYTPVVESIVRTRSRDVRHIENTLDGLLSFCGYEPALVLFKTLCRHYWDIDPSQPPIMSTFIANSGTRTKRNRPRTRTSRTGVTHELPEISKV